MMLSLELIDNIFSSISNDRSQTYDLSVEELFNMNDMNLFRKDHAQFQNTLLQLSVEDKLLVKNEILQAVKNYRKNSNFNFYELKFGSSKKRMELSLQLLKSATNNDNKKRVCELGSNTGEWTALWFLHNQAIDSSLYSCCDIIPEYCQLLSLFGFHAVPLNLAKENIIELMPHDNDVVILTEVIEHLTNKKLGIQLILDATTILAKNGTMIVSYPRDVGEISSSPIGHQYQPDKNEINNSIHHLFSNVAMFFDGSREYHCFSGFKK
jgi:hypothetical protein